MVILILDLISTVNGTIYIVHVGLFLHGEAIVVIVVARSLVQLKLLLYICS